MSCFVATNSSAAQTSYWKHCFALCSMLPGTKLI